MSATPAHNMRDRDGLPSGARPAAPAGGAETVSHLCRARHQSSAQESRRPSGHAGLNRRTAFMSNIERQEGKSMATEARTLERLQYLEAAPIARGIVARWWIGRWQSWWRWKKRLLGVSWRSCRSAYGFSKPNIRCHQRRSTNAFEPGTGRYSGYGRMEHLLDEMWQSVRERLEGLERNRCDGVAAVRG